MKKLTPAEVRQALRRMWEQINGAPAPDPFPRMACSACGALSPDDYELVVEQDDDVPNKIWIKAYICPVCEVKSERGNRAQRRRRGIR